MSIGGPTKLQPAPTTMRTAPARQRSAVFGARVARRPTTIKAQPAMLEPTAKGVQASHSPQTDTTTKPAAPTTACQAQDRRDTAQYRRALAHRTERNQKVVNGSTAHGPPSKAKVTRSTGSPWLLASHKAVSVNGVKAKNHVTYGRPSERPRRTNSPRNDRPGFHR
jgi:hypothetical protein